MLAETYVRAEGAFPLIGAGGIDSGAAAFAKIKAGACLIQLYSGAGFPRRRAGRRASRADLLECAAARWARRHRRRGGRDAAAMTAESGRSKWPT